MPHLKVAKWHHYLNSFPRKSCTISPFSNPHNKIGNKITMHVQLQTSFVFHYNLYLNRIYLHFMVEIELCKCQQGVRYLRLCHLTMPLGVPQASIFRGRAFGVLGCHGMWNFVVWATTLGRVLTIDNHHKRHLLIVGWCCMCKSSGEFVAHSLLHWYYNRYLVFCFCIVWGSFGDDIICDWAHVMLAMTIPSP